MRLRARVLSVPAAPRSARPASTSLPARPVAPFVAAACAVLATLAVPALGRAQSGGAALSGNPDAPGEAQPAGGRVSSSENGVTLATQRSAFLARRLVFAGSAPSQDAGETIELQRYGHQTHWRWATTAAGTIGADGTFQVSWQVNHIGRFAFRAIVTRPGGGGATSAASSTVRGGAASAAWPTVTVTVYRPSLATEYGPGFYGRRTACGQILRRTTLGVANRRLPCGMKVAIYYRGSAITVPVIDRGPYANGADWDLTIATGRALGVPGTARIGAVSLPRGG